MNFYGFIAGIARDGNSTFKYCVNRLPLMVAKHTGAYLLKLFTIFQSHLFDFGELLRATMS